MSVLKSVFASVAETGADGALVELAAGDPHAAASLQSAGMATRTTGSFLAGAALARTRHPSPSLFPERRTES